MSDIVERLRSPEFSDVAAKYLMAEAADELERLRSILKEAGEAMLKMHVAVDHDDPWGKDNVNRFNSAVRENLAVLSKIKGEA